MFNASFNDRFIFSFNDGKISPETLEGFTYEVSDNKNNQNSQFTSVISFVKINKIIPPDIHDLNASANTSTAKDGKVAPPQEEQSFFRKYVS